MSVSVSVLTLCAISVERYYAICHPLQFQATVKRTRLIIAIIWIVSLLILLPDVIVLDTHNQFPPELTILLTTCKPTWDYHLQFSYQLFLIFTLFVLPVGLMGVAYTRIAVELWSASLQSWETHNFSRNSTTVSGRQYGGEFLMHENYVLNEHDSRPEIQ